jgi:hypothetical protein
MFWLHHLTIIMGTHKCCIYRNSECMRWPLLHSLQVKCQTEGIVRTCGHVANCVFWVLLGYVFGIRICENLVDLLDLVAVIARILRDAVRVVSMHWISSNIRVVSHIDKVRRCIRETRHSQRPSCKITVAISESYVFTTHRWDYGKYDSHVMYDRNWIYSI